MTEQGLPVGAAPRFDLPALEPWLIAAYGTLLCVVACAAAAVDSESLRTLATFGMLPLALYVGALHPRAALFSLLFLAPMLDSRTAIELGRGVPDVSFGRIVLGAVLVSLAVRALRGERIPVLRPTWLDALGLAALLGLVPGLLGSVDATALQRAFGLFAVPLLVCGLARSLLRTSDHLDALFVAIVAFASVLAVYAIVESTTRTLWVPPPSGDAQVNTSLGGGGDLWLIRGLFGRANQYARLMLVSLPIVLALGLGARGRPQRALLALLGGLQLAALALTFNRSAWLAAIAEVVVFAAVFAWPHRRARRLVAAGAALLAALVLATLVCIPHLEQGGPALERITRRLDTLNGRLPRWQAGVGMWAEQPVAGWGFGYVRDHLHEFQPDTHAGDPLDAVESDYLYLGIAGGVVALGPYLLLVGLPLLASLRLVRGVARNGWADPADARRLAVYWSCAVGFLLASATVVLNNPANRAIPLALFAAILTRFEPVLRARRSLSDDSA